ncbi:MAG: copper chaperone PCu(A)C [Halieaceae bacterium]|jgi:copper(I)-binding protein|nr:copper chaperone PCu(A)C [Halieaceae bacterium]
MRSLVLIVLMSFLSPAWSAEVVEAWMRAMPPGQPTAAAYLLLRNDSTAARRVVGARSGQAQRVEFHESVETAGRWRMRQLDSLTVPAQGELAMQPGGVHLMLFDVERSLQEGDSLDLVLEMDNGAELSVVVDVRPIEGDRPQQHHHHQ